MATPSLRQRILCCAGIAISLIALGARAEKEAVFDVKSDDAGSVKSAVVDNGEAPAVRITEEGKDAVTCGVVSGQTEGGCKATSATVSVEQAPAKAGADKPDTYQLQVKKAGKTISYEVELIRAWHWWEYLQPWPSCMTYENLRRSGLTDEEIAESVGLSKAGSKHAKADYEQKTRQIANTADGQALGNFGVSVGGEATLVRTQLADAYAPAFKESCPGTALGFHFAAAVPADAQSLKDYARQQLLLTDGGLFTAGVSLGRSFRFVPGDSRTAGWRALRASHNDRVYALSSLKKSTEDQLWFYVTDGVTARGLKTTLEGDAHIKAMGTVYVGIGLDGPLFQEDPGSPAGGVDIQGRFSANITNRDTLKDLFGDAQAEYKRTFFNAGVIATAYIYQKLSASIEYQTVVGGHNRPALRDVAVLTIGYNRAAEPKKAPH